MISRFRVRMGAIEIECEGTEDFLKSEVPELLKTVTELCSKAGNVSATEGEAEGDACDETHGSAQHVAATTRSIATQLGSKTGADLAMAAAAKLDLVDGYSTFSRKQILDEMKTATGHYKATFRNNLSKSLASLVKDDRLREPSSEKYCLSAAPRAELETKLAG